MEIKSNSFLPSNEVLQNPYMGFVSFNHFRDEPLFSDCPTTDGWIKEHYPVYDWVEQEGRKQGFYPDTEIAYIRIVWKDFEPKEKEYNFALTDEIFAKAKAKNQSVMLRLMPHTTRENEDVPNWLREQIPCPARPTSARVKESPTHPMFLRKFARAIEKIGERYDGDPAFYAMDISLTGAWGEGHHYANYPESELRLLVDAYTRSFKKTNLLGQICAPELVKYGRKTKPIGWRADGLANPYHMNRYFPKRIYPMKDAWKTAPVSFESFWFLGEWKKQGWDIDEIIEQTLKWHVSSINGKSSSIPFEWKEKIDGWLKKMGYRFAVRTIEYPDQTEAGQKAEILLWVENRGVAPIYNHLPFTLKLVGDGIEQVYPTKIDITKWLPGDSIEKIKIALPKNMKKGAYKLYCSIGGGELPVVQMAMQTEKDGAWYYLATLEVV